MSYLPKQWLHWAESCRLRPESSKRYTGWERYLKGRGHYWRVNRLGEFQISEQFSTFDRWANSTAASIDHIPQSKEDFQKTVAILLRSARITIYPVRPRWCLSDPKPELRPDTIGNLFWSASGELVLPEYSNEPFVRKSHDS